MIALVHVIGLLGKVPSKLCSCARSHRLWDACTLVENLECAFDPETAECCVGHFETFRVVRNLAMNLPDMLPVKDGLPLLSCLDGWGSLDNGQWTLLVVMC